MKMTVIADKSGKVISTYMHPERPGKNDPTLHISGGPRHTPPSGRVGRPSIPSRPAAGEGGAWSLQAKGGKPTYLTL
jgi:hypothetical protein